MCNIGCSQCPFKDYENIGDCEEFIINNTQKVIEILAEWKEQHEKKEPEVEKYEAVRIVECSTGIEKVVYEEPVSEDFDYEQDSIDAFVEETLLKYCKEHKGTYEAYMAHVFRVKEL